MLEREFKFYVEHQDELVKEYLDKYVVIVGEKVVAAYDDITKAYLESKKRYKRGTFMIQLCQPGVENYTVTLHRATFRDPATPV